MARFSRLRRVGMAALALAVVGGVVLWAAGSGAPRTIRRQPLALRSQMAAHRPLRTPPVFAAAASELELRSVSTGRVVKVLRRTGGSWTNNGLAFSPDGRYVYFTLIPESGRRWSSLLLERTSVATGERSLVGHGEQPSLSPTGRLLAYASGNDRSAAIVVRDVTTGAERSINISR